MESKYFRTREYAKLHCCNKNSICIAKYFDGECNEQSNRKNFFQNRGTCLFIGSPA